MSEPVEWEYAIKTVLTTMEFRYLEEAEQWLKTLEGVNPNARLVRRRKAGPWEELE